MSKEREGKKKSGKTPPSKTPKEKKAAKRAKRNAKDWSEQRKRDIDLNTIDYGQG